MPWVCECVWAGTWSDTTSFSTKGSFKFLNRCLKNAHTARSKLKDTLQHAVFKLIHRSVLGINSMKRIWDILWKLPFAGMIDGREFEMFLGHWIWSWSSLRTWCFVVAVVIFGRHVAQCSVFSWCNVFSRLLYLKFDARFKHWEIQSGFASE